jgi:transposase
VIATGGRRIVVATMPVDFRRGMDSLAGLVQLSLGASPFCGDVYIFRSKRADRVKILAWDGSGLWLLQKRLEKSRFAWPPIRDGVIVLSSAQLNMLLEGLDWSKVAPTKIRAPELAC